MEMTLRRRQSAATSHIPCPLLLLLLLAATQPGICFSSSRMLRKGKRRTAGIQRHRSPILRHRSQWEASKIPRSGEPSEGSTGTHKVAAAVTVDARNIYHIVEASGDGSSFATNPSCVAWGAFTDSIGSAGWGALEIHTKKGYSDERQMYAAGLLEGAMTHKRIRQLYVNDIALRSPKSLRGLYEYFKEQDTYLRSHVHGANGPEPAKPHDEDEAYWRQVVLIMSQLDGLLDGYNHKSREEHQLVLGDMWLLNMDGDVIDLERAIDLDAIDFVDTDEAPAGSFGDLLGSSVAKSLLLLEKERKDAQNPQSPGRYSKQRWDKLMRHARCSALIKVLPDFSDVLVGHATWADYSELLRIWKTYNFPLSGVRAKSMSFSSYAGMLSSTDDWYITDQQLLVTETTTQVEDESTLRGLDPRSQVDSWVRTMVANRLASNGETWSRLYVKGNSGTYNCQWMVLDFKLFTPGKPPKDGFYTMTEIIPGLYRSEDMTSVLLNRGEEKCNKEGDDQETCHRNTMYWPSVNRPFWPDIRARAGYPEDDPEAPNNDFFSFENNPRGRVFARDQIHIKTIHDMMSMISYNDPRDPLQEDAGHAIASRFDIPGADANDPTARPNGAIDFKVSSASLVAKMISVSQIGPTHNSALPPWRGHDDGSDMQDAKTPKAVREPFRWDASKAFSFVPHFGVPMELDFDWQILGPGKLDLPQDKDSVESYLKDVLSGL